MVKIIILIIYLFRFTADLMLTNDDFTFALSYVYPILIQIDSNIVICSHDMMEIHFTYVSEPCAYLYLLNS